MRILYNKIEVKNKKIKNRLNQTFTDSEISKLKKDIRISKEIILIFDEI